MKERDAGVPEVRVLEGEHFVSRGGPGSHLGAGITEVELDGELGEKGFHPGRQGGREEEILPGKSNRGVRLEVRSLAK